MVYSILVPYAICSPHGQKTDLFVIESATEEVLLKHELEKQRLAEEVQQKGPVLQRLSRYFELHDEMRKLEVP